MIKGRAIILTNGLLDTVSAKTCHGLLRGSERFEIAAVIDAKFAGQDAGIVMDGYELGIPIFESVEDFFENHSSLGVGYCIVGVALHGGHLPEEMVESLAHAIKYSLTLISGLHAYLCDIPELLELSSRYNVELIDLRKPKPASQLHFWTGKIYEIETPRIAVLGMDCAIGKRTTCRFLMESCRAHGIYAEMIYTGQTGWMQGYPHGFIFDATLNDFVSGEMEKAIIDCNEALSPDLILIEGQSGLRNPSGPCGSEVLLSGDVKGVVLVHAPSRKYYDETVKPIASIDSEISLIKHFGAEVLAIALNEDEADEAFLNQQQLALQERLGIPVIRPLLDGVASLVPAIQAFMQQSVSSNTCVKKN